MNMRKRLLSSIMWVLVFAVLVGNIPVLAADADDITTAVAAINNLSPLSCESSSVNTEPGAKALVEIAVSAATSSLGVTTAVSGSFTPAVNGTPGNLAGTNGSYVATVNISKGIDTPGTAYVTLIINAQAYDTTQDNADITAAKNAIEGASYTAQQTAVTTSAQAKNAVLGIINGLGMNGVTASINEVAFTVAAAGTPGAASGTNGSYTFTVTLSKGGGTQQTTAARTLTITATPYDTDQAEVNSAASILVWGHIRSSNAADQPGGVCVVTSTLSLPTSSAYISGAASGISISWSLVAGGGIDTATGAITATTTTTATLRATLVKNGKTAMKDFQLSIQPTANAQAQIDAVRGWLTWDIIRGSNASTMNGSRYNIMNHLSLSVSIPASISNVAISDVTLTWTVEGGVPAATINTSNGVVTFPTSGNGQQVTLIATIKRGTTTVTNNTVAFPLTIMPSANQATIAAAATRLTWDTTTSGYVRIRKDNATGFTGGYRVVTNDLELPITMRSDGTGSAHDIDISWEARLYSNNAITSIITTSDTNIGKVSIPLADTYVYLTATLTLRNGTYAENSALSNNAVTFPLQVKAGNAQLQVDAMRSWLTWDKIRGSGNAQQSSAASNNHSGNRLNVTANLMLQPTLPSSVSYNSADVSTNGVTFEWSISGGVSTATINPSTGIVTFPISGSRDVILTATIRREGATVNNNTVTFYLSLQPSVDQTAINEAISWLVWNQIRGSNDASTSSTGPYLTLTDLVLPTTFQTSDSKTVNIRWNTSHSSNVNTNGTVSPTTSGSVTVTLTAVLTYGSFTDTSTTNNPNSKAFSLTVRAPNNTEAVRMDKEALLWDKIKGNNVNQYEVTSSLTLPTTGRCGTTIVWNTSNTMVITTGGLVVPPTSGSATVILTATISKGTVSDTKVFTLAVYKSVSVFSVTETNGNMTAQIQMADFNRMTDYGTKGFELKSNLCTIRFDAVAAKTIAGAGAGSVSVTASKTDSSKLSETMRTAAGSRPVFELTVWTGNQSVTNFNGGAATVIIPYTLGDAENPNAVFVNHLNTDGSLGLVRGYYNPSERSVIFTTAHFSHFVIQHRPVTFSDVPADFKKEIDFIASSGITEGIGGNLYAPNRSLTRAEFIVFMMKAYGITPDATWTDNFADAGKDNWYSGWLATAKRLKLTDGTGGNNFSPNNPVTVEETLILMHRLVTAFGEKLEKSSKGKSLSSFADRGVISGWAQEDININRLQEVTEAGIYTEDLLMPTKIVNRASMARMLYNLMVR